MAIGQLKAQKIEDLDYTTYRNWMQQISHMKKQLENVSNKRRLKHAEYRKAFKEYIKLAEREDTLRDKLINMIPNRF